MMNFKEAEARIKAGEKLTLEQVFGPADPNPDPALLEPYKIIVVVRYQGRIRWHCSDRDYWILDHKKSAQEGKDFGFDVPPFDPSFRGGMEVVDVDNAEAFLNLPDNHLLNFEHWRKTLVDAMPSAQSWWDVGDMFPIAFVDFDHKRFAGFYNDGLRLERYVPDGWVGEFVDFANTYPEEIFPAADKFWIVDGVDLLRVLNERGQQQVDEARKKKSWWFKLTR